MRNDENISTLADAQSKRENRALASLLSLSFIGSTCIHAIAMITPVSSLWKPVSKESDITMELFVDTYETTKEEIPEIAKDPESFNSEINQATDENVHTAIALAPETLIPLKEGKDTAAPDKLKPTLTTGISEFNLPLGSGKVISKDGIGSGFGNNKISTEFVLGGNKNGHPDGKKDGTLKGTSISTNSKDGKGAQIPTSLIPVVTPAIETKPRQLECLNCPKPQYRGKEGVPRVTYDIAPDGRVTNVRLRQSSGDAETDRETLEAMQKWQFNPQTIPEGGRTNVKVRVTFEEQGSQFQRENEERRRAAEQQRLAEQERQPQDVKLPVSTAIPPNNQPSNPVNNADHPTSLTAEPAINPTPTITQPSPVKDSPSLTPTETTPVLPPPPERK